MRSSELVAVSESGVQRECKGKFGFGRATTDHHELLADKDVDAVLIATRHASHAASREALSWQDDVRGEASRAHWRK